MERYEAVKRSKKEIIFNNFLGGIAWALGATIGLSLIIAILGVLAHRLDFIPIVGSFVSNIIDFVLKTNPHFRQ